MNFEQRLKSLRDKVSSYPDANLVAVSKTFSQDDIKKAYDLGLRDFGENYFQEAFEKMDLLEGAGIRWHFLGKIQSNKLKKAQGRFSLFHSFDSLKYFEKLDSLSSSQEKVLIQLRDPQDQRPNGVSFEEAEVFFESVQTFSKVDCVGLMYLPSPGLDEAALCHNFKKARNVFDQIRVSQGLSNKEWTILSMGMSQDYELALDCGSTLVRIGSKIFGQRRLS